MATALRAKDEPSPIDQPGHNHAMITRYTVELGWPLVIVDGGVFLPGHLGIVGLSLSAGLAGEVNTEIRRRELAVPIIAIPGGQTRWVFLVETPEARFPSLPAGVGVMGGATRIPLPPTEVGGEPVRWVAEPGTGFVGVPPLAPILNAVRYFTSPRTL